MCVCTFFILFVFRYYRYLLIYILTQGTDFKYATYKCTVGFEQQVEFEGDEITLDIAEEEVILPDGWKITPCSHPRESLSLHTHQAESLSMQTFNSSKEIRLTVLNMYQLARCM